MSGLQRIEDLILGTHADSCPVCAGCVPEKGDGFSTEVDFRHYRKIQEQAQELYDLIRSET